MAICPVALYLSPGRLIGTQSVGLGSTVTHYLLIFTNYIYKDPVSKSSHILRFWVDLNLSRGEHCLADYPFNGLKKGKGGELDGQHISEPHFLICKMGSCCSVTQSSDPLRPMHCSMPGFLVLPYLLELAQTHVHCVSDAIQPSHPLMPPSPLALNLYQHQGVFQ